MDISPRTHVLESATSGRPPGAHPAALAYTRRFGPVDAATVAPEVDPRLAFELRRWQVAEPGQARDGYTLAWLVACHLRARGRDHLDGQLLVALADIRVRHRGHDRFIDAYLDCVLARHQCGFGSREYLALPLLELIIDDDRTRLGRERLAVLLVADVIRYESRPESVATLDGYTRENRALHAARFIAEAEPSLASGVPMPPGTAAGEWMALTVLPVSAAHDEYLLIRALQAQELLFDLLTDMITSATGSVRGGDLTGAAEVVRQAHRVFRRADTLVRLLSTMGGADVEVVADHLRGSTALRSRAHQRFENACRTSSARGGLGGALADQCGPLTSPALAELMEVMATLEVAHQAWKAVHHGPAADIVGAASGCATAETAAVLHVQDCMENRLFGTGALRAAPV